MPNFLKLNLPPNPLKDIKQIEEMIVTGGYNLRRPADVLNDEILQTFQAMDLKPRFVSFFGRNDHDGRVETRMIHTDIQHVSGSTNVKSNWKKILFGINWEIHNSHNIFSWWNMEKLQELWPDEDYNPASKYRILNGIHYVARGGLGIPEGAIKIEETQINMPTLVRTDIPHMTVYKNPDKKRIGLSVRFDESGFSDWGQVLDFFQPYAALQ